MQLLDTESDDHPTAVAQWESGTMYRAGDDNAQVLDVISDMLMIQLVSKMLCPWYTVVVKMDERLAAWCSSMTQCRKSKCKGSHRNYISNRATACCP